MNANQVAYLICGIVTAILLVLAIVYFWYRTKHPLDILSIERSNWFMKWIRSNITLVMSLTICVLLIISVTFFVCCGINYQL